MGFVLSICFSVTPLAGLHLKPAVAKETWKPRRLRGDRYSSNFVSEPINWRRHCRGRGHLMAPQRLSQTFKMPPLRIPSEFFGVFFVVLIDWFLLLLLLFISIDAAISIDGFDWSVQLADFHFPTWAPFPGLWLLIYQLLWTLGCWPRRRNCYDFIAARKLTLGNSTFSLTLIHWQWVLLPPRPHPIHPHYSVQKSWKIQINWLGDCFCISDPPLLVIISWIGFQRDGNIRRMRPVGEGGAEALSCQHKFRDGVKHPHAESSGKLPALISLPSTRSFIELTWHSIGISTSSLPPPSADSISQTGRERADCCTSGNNEPGQLCCLEIAG